MARMIEQDIEQEADSVADSPNTSAGVLSDEDVAKVQQVTDEQTKALESTLDDSLQSHDAAIIEGVRSAIESIDESNAGTVETVRVDAEQWQELNDSLQYQHDSMQLQSSFMLFVLMLLAAVIGMRFFSEFAKGFRHD